MSETHNSVIAVIGIDIGKNSFHVIELIIGATGLDFRDILLRVWRNIGKHRILALAAGITFYALLAIFPGIGATFALYGLFRGPPFCAANVRPAFGRAAGRRPRHPPRPGHPPDRAAFRPARVRLSSGLATSLWSARSGVRALLDTLNIVYGEE